MNIVIQCTPEEARALFQGRPPTFPGAKEEAQVYAVEEPFDPKQAQQDALHSFGRFQRAVQSRDAAALKDVEAFIADGYTLIDQEGRRIGKKQTVQDLQSKRTSFRDFDRSEQMVQAFQARRVAVLTSVISMRGEINAKDIQGQFVDTNVLMQDDKGWVLVASHLSPLSELVDASIA